MVIVDLYCIDYLLLMIGSLLFWLPIVDDRFIIVLITYCWWSVHYCFDYLLLMIGSLLYWLPIVDDGFIIVLITYCWWWVHYCIDCLLLMISSLLYWLPIVDDQFIIVLITPASRLSLSEKLIFMSKLQPLPLSNLLIYFSPWKEVTLRLMGLLSTTFTKIEFLI